MTGTWAEGCLQLLVAFGMLSQPIGVYIGTPERIVRLEYVTGWILVRRARRPARLTLEVAAGLVNLLLTGMVDQSLIRAQRKQADSFEVRRFQGRPTLTLCSNCSLTSAS